MTDTKQAGEVITFYSYKGGTGRSMALANIACLLARQADDRGVLAVDWDLEAPGLHRYFRTHVGSSLDSKEHLSEAFLARPGLIDLLEKLKQLTASLPVLSEEAPQASYQALRDGVSIDDYVIDTDIKSLHFMKAGRFDPDYASRINTFGWEQFFTGAPWALPWLLQWLTEKYRYVLIDSRTGVTDTSGICTALLPEKLVVVFTPNRQSLEGAVDSVRRAVIYRGSSDDLRPLRVFPLPSRVEPARPTLQTHWRFSSEVGYQPTFEALFTELYALEECNLGPYFDDVQIQHVPDYAYGEEIAVLLETGDRLSLARSYETFASRLTAPTNPWETETKEYDPRKAALAFALVLQSICLEFHVSRFTRELGISDDEGLRAFGQNTLLKQELFQRIKSDAEWVVKRWTEDDLLPRWHQDRARLAEARLPGISADIGFAPLLVTVVRHLVSILEVAVAERDLDCEIKITSGWKAWNGVARALGQNGPVARELPSVYGETSGVRLKGPLSAFVRVLQQLEQEFGRRAATLARLDVRSATGYDAGLQQECLDLATLLGGCWSGLASEQKLLFEHAIEKARSAAAPTLRQLEPLIECDFLRWMTETVTPAWRKARDEYRDLGFEVSDTMDFTEFFSFYLSMVSKLIHEGRRNLGDFSYAGGYAVEKEAWETVVALRSSTTNLESRPARWSSGSVQLVGPFNAFAALFDDASRRLINALRRVHQP